MKKKVIRSLLTVTLVAMFLSVGVIVSPANTVAVQAANVSYNIFATDGYVSLADGTPLYIYGFIGGRAGQSLTYQNSVVAPPNAPKTFVPGAAVTVPTGAPNPTGGVITAQELPLAGNAQLPGPVIYATAGDVVTINFKNLGVTKKTAPNDPHSIHLHGLDVDAANDGVPETSVGAVPANLAIPGAGNVIVYMFNTTKEGTYMYHCHQEADIHVQMGMYGALVIYNPGDPAAAVGPGQGAGGTIWGWKYDKDVIMMLTEVDTRQHVSEAAGRGGAAAFNPVNYQPQYWLINGLSFPNTVHAAVAGKGVPFVWANWIAAHPGYDPLIAGSVSAASSAGTTGQKVLIRVINLGFETQPMHMHGFHGKILGSDQRQWSWAQPAGLNVSNDTGLEKNTLTIGSGETYEWLVDFGKQGLNHTYAAGTQSRYGPAPAILPQLNTNTAAPAIPVPAPAVGMTYIGGPTVGGTIDPAINAANNLTPTGPQIFPFHNHDDYKATNNGVYPGGQFTVLVPLP